MVCMMLIDEVPDSGMILLVIRFSGYKDSYQNDSRRKLDSLPKSIKSDDLGIWIQPVSFSLIKTVLDGVSRATGAMQTYSFSELNPEKFVKLYKAIEQFCASPEWWGTWEIMIAQGVILEG